MDRSAFPPETNMNQILMANKLFRHYGMRPQGLSVVKVGGHFTTVDLPAQEALVGKEGVDWFQGGHIYTVTAVVAAALTADGYVVT